MGSRMARRLVDAGYRVTIFDTDRSGGADSGGGGSARGGLAGGRGLGGGDRAGELAHSSGGAKPSRRRPRRAAGEDIRRHVDDRARRMQRRIAADLAAKNITAMDAPVSGGLAGAANGTLAVMVSATEEAFAS